MTFDFFSGMNIGMSLALLVVMYYCLQKKMFIRALICVLFAVLNFGVAFT